MTEGNVTTITEQTNDQPFVIVINPDPALSQIKLIDEHLAEVNGIATEDNIHSVNGLNENGAPEEENSVENNEIPVVGDETEQVSSILAFFE